MGVGKLKGMAARYGTNLRGWHTNRRIVVIESDDWGSIRMPSAGVYRKCLEAGYPVDTIAYEMYDSLLSRSDLESLFGLLSSFRDKNGNHPVITANCVVANPDFEKIAADRFERYHFEPITETFRKYPEHAGNLQIWQQAMDNGVFHPQFHAREHLNVALFMEKLRENDPDAHFGFRHGMPGCISRRPGLNGNNYTDAFAFRSAEEKDQVRSSVLGGLDLFAELFGFRSESLIAPNYTWSLDFDRDVFEKGVRYFQGIRRMREPLAEGGFKFYSAFTGMKNGLGQVYLTRNAWFEPSMFRLGIKDPVEKCLSDMAIAFRMKKPAIINSHRINYVGFIDPGNRQRTLGMLKLLLQKALKKWPDIEFMSSARLGKVIENGN